MQPTMPGPPPPLRPLRVLILDASAVSRQLAEFLLRQRGHVAETTFNIGDAYQRLATAKPFDLLLVDANVDVSDLAELRRRAESPERRVVICALISEGMAAPESCDDSLARPLDLGKLDSLLARLFEPAVDVPALLKQLGSNRQLLKPMVQLLEKNARIWESGVRAAIEAGDADSVRRLAHQAKGALGNFAARQAVAAARALEEIGHSGDLGEAGKALSELSDQIHRVQTALEESLLP